MGWMCRRARVQREKREKHQQHQRQPPASCLGRALGVGGRQGLEMRAGAELSPACAFGLLHFEWRGWSHPHSNPPVTVIVPPARSVLVAGLRGRTQSASRRVWHGATWAWLSRPAWLNKTRWVGGSPREWPRREPGPAGRVQDSGAAQCSIASPEARESCSLPSPGLTLRALTRRDSQGRVPVGRMRACPHLFDPGFRFCRCAALVREVTGLRWCCSLASGHSRTGTRAMGVVLGWHPGRAWICVGSVLDDAGSRLAERFSILPRHSPAQQPQAKRLDRSFDVGRVVPSPNNINVPNVQSTWKKKKGTTVPCLRLCLCFCPPRCHAGRTPARLHACTPARPHARRPRATSRCAPDRPLDSRLATSRRGGGQRGTWLQSLVQSHVASHAQPATIPQKHIAAGVWHRLGVQTRRAGWCRGTAATSRELRTPLARRSAPQEPEINTTVRCIWAHLVRFAVPWFATPSLDILCKKRASSRVDREWRNSVHPPVPASGLVKLLKRHDDAMRCDAVW